MAKRRANGDGHLRQRPNGTWELCLMIGFHDDGRRKYKSFYGKTQKEVKDKAKAYQSAKAEGIEMDVVYTFEEWADMWFESHKDNIMPTTQENYKYTLRTLKSFFGRRKIRDIKPFDIEMMLKKLRHDGRSLHYLAQCRGMMFQIMNKAEANDLIRKNPVRFAEKMRYREPVKRKDAFTAEEVSILMERLPEDRIGLSIRLMLGTGMRTQEILALEPRHIEPDARSSALSRLSTCTRAPVLWVHPSLATVTGASLYRKACATARLPCGTRIRGLSGKSERKTARVILLISVTSSKRLCRPFPKYLS